MEEIKQSALQMYLKIRMRNFFESAVCIFLIFIFAQMLLSDVNLTIKLFCFEIILCACFIIFVFNTKGRFRKIAEDLNDYDFVDAYIRELQKQISILSRVRYWYVGPLLFGLLGLHLERIIYNFRIGFSILLPISMLIILLLLSIYLVYVNEIKQVEELQLAVNKLKKISLESSK